MFIIIKYSVRMCSRQVNDRIRAISIDALSYLSHLKPISPPTVAAGSLSTSMLSTIEPMGMANVTMRIKFHVMSVENSARRVWILRGQGVR